MEQVLFDRFIKLREELAGILDRLIHLFLGNQTVGLLHLRAKSRKNSRIANMPLLIDADFFNS